jgi:hypothetical protein
MPSAQKLSGDHQCKNHTEGELASKLFGLFVFLSIRYLQRTVSQVNQIMYLQVESYVSSLLASLIHYVEATIQND